LYGATRVATYSLSRGYLLRGHDIGLGELTSTCVRYRNDGGIFDAGMIPQDRF
jgi:hypothetical protein